jgi:hypothetical protein
VTSPTQTSPIHGLAEWRRFLGEGLRVAVGRIFGFGRLDRATHQARARLGKTGGIARPD